MSMKNLFTLRTLHATLKDITVFLCVALPIVYCVGLLYVVYALDNNIMLLAYYAVNLIAGISVVTGLCILATIGIGLYLKERR